MPDFGRNPRDVGGGEPSLDAIRRSDEFIDALAGGRQAAPADPADEALASLLGGWRDEMRWPPATGLVSEPQAIAALNAGLSGKSGGRGREPRWDNRVNPDARVGSQRSRRGLSVVGASAAAALCIGGFGAVVAGAGPGDALYGLRTMLFGAQKQVRDDQVGLAARTELQQVQEMIARGDWEQAQDKLVAVSSQVESIDNVEQKQQLLDQFNDLSAKVVERDAEATAPPGIIYTVPPSAAELVPAVAPPTSVPIAPPTDATTSGTPETSGAPATTSETGESSSESSSETPGSSAPSTSVPDSSSATSSAAAQSQQTTTPTSAAPATSSAASASSPATTTNAPPTTSITPKSSATVPQTTTSAEAEAPTTTAPAATRAVTTTAAPTPAQATAPETATGTPQAVQTTPPEVLPAQQSATTTVLIPLPVPAG